VARAADEGLQRLQEDVDGRQQRRAAAALGDAPEALGLSG